MGNIEHYYDSINAAASGITDHHEKQKFLKVLYENFYKVYNPKAADRLGVVYTPNEIVQFMIESTDYLLHKHFGKSLADKNVDILDPASGTGTFITSIIDHIPKQNLVYKYNNELHANEVAILPYYIANLNVEFTFKQKMGYYEEFKNLCFVDTLDNTDANAYAGKQHSLFGLTSENSERIKRQNSKKISVIIGNPPYNANQANENDNNKNREYPSIDKRIRETFNRNSTAQNLTKTFDMYTRFFRWSMDRIQKNGVLSFITNRSYLDSRMFDGFRKYILDNFSQCYIIDTKSDIRINPKIAGTTHNVFGIKTGVAIIFLIRKENHESPCKIEYIALEDEWRKEIKLEWLRNNKINEISFLSIIPDINNNWINQTQNDFEKLVPLIDKNLKCGRKANAIFEKYSLGAQSSRDEWVFDYNKNSLLEKIKYFIKIYNENIGRKEIDLRIKWSSSLVNHLASKKSAKFSEDYIVECLFRPFTKKLFYTENILNHRLTKNHYEAFGDSLRLDNRLILFSGVGSDVISFLASSKIVEYKTVGTSTNGATQFIPYYTYNNFGKEVVNITDWGLEQFRNYYCKDASHASPKAGEVGVITKEDIFHYTYAVLHNPAYRKKYELNLKREFPRIPFYSDFWQWAKWGKELMELHINYETVEPYDLRIIENTIHGEKIPKNSKVSGSRDESKERNYELQPKIKVKLKADKEAGIIELDEQTQLTGIPKEAWEYKLGNRSALEWILDQYKEKKPTDPTIAEKFNTYRFADYKETVIDLLKRVCTVSVETMKIVREMEKIN